MLNTYSSTTQLLLLYLIVKCASRPAYEECLLFDLCQISNTLLIWFFLNLTKLPLFTFYFLIVKRLFLCLIFNFRKWTSTIREQESDRLAPVSNDSWSFFKFVFIFFGSLGLTLLLWIVLDCRSSHLKLSRPWLFSGIIYISTVDQFEISLSSFIRIYVNLFNFMQSSEFAELSIKDIDQVARTSFPLCMRHLFEKVRDSLTTRLTGVHVKL